MLPYTLKPLNSAPLCLVTTVFFKTVLAPHYSTKVLCTCHDIFIAIQKSIIFHEFHTSHWFTKYLKSQLISWDTINTF
jgi:hypothetical protein